MIGGGISCGGRSQWRRASVVVCQSFSGWSAGGDAVAVLGWLGIDGWVKRRPVAKKKVVRPVVYKPSEEGLLM
jgi:hypothetical protein